MNIACEETEADVYQVQAQTVQGQIALLQMAFKHDKKQLTYMHM
jgi:hypothetical protein